MSEQDSPARAAVWKCSDTLSEYAMCVGIVHDAMRDFVDSQGYEAEPNHEDVLGALSVARIARQATVDAWNEGGMTFAAAFLELCKISQRIDVPAVGRELGTSHHHASLHAYATLHSRLQWLVAYQGANLIDLWGEPDAESVEGLKIRIRRQDFAGIELPELNQGLLGIELAQAALIADSREWPKFVHPEHLRNDFKVSGTPGGTSSLTLVEPKQSESFTAAVKRLLVEGVNDRETLKTRTGATDSTIRWARYQFKREKTEREPRRVKRRN